MSEVAGRMSIQAGSHVLEKTQGGRGMLLGGVPGVAPAKVVVIGGGPAGMASATAAEIAELAPISTDDSCDVTGLEASA